ncbi:MAG: hypothetical protein M1814_005173 [Vezdaea aestivalis]|nr:MAG: hypothetical protein M1814_005173 [Vezdaea aestivalis]
MDSNLAFEAEAKADAQLASTHRRRESPASNSSNGAHPVIGTGPSSRGEETSPLLNDPTVPLSSEGGDDDWEGLDDFKGLPWHKTPSVYWLMPPFALYALAFGVSMVPKLDLTIELLCRQLLSEHALAPPNVPSSPYPPSQKNPMCQTSVPVQIATSNFTLATGLISGIIAAITSPILGDLSDRKGRKYLLAVTSLGTLVGEVIFILAATFPRTVSVYWILASSALDGLCGSFIAALAISFAYTSDSHPPKGRNVKFAYLYACFFAAVGLGPILSGFIVKASGKLVTMMYIAVAFHAAFISILLLFVPESLSRRRKEIAQRKHQQRMESEEPTSWWRKLRFANLFAPLKLLFPTGKGTSSALRMNLVLLAAVDTIMFGVAMGSITVILLYGKKQFEWGNFETAEFVSIVNSSRVLILVAALPVVSKLIRKYAAPPPPDSAGSDTADVWLIRTAIFFDTLALLGYTLARESKWFIMSGVVSAIGGFGSPTISSSLTKHVPPDRTGQVMGTMGLLHSLARVVAPTLFHSIYSATVGKFDQTVFVCLTATFGIAFVLSWFIRPYIYYSEPDTSQSSDHE